MSHLERFHTDYAGDLAGLLPVGLIQLAKRDAFGVCIDRYGEG
jgi:hypothetical protein